MDQQRRRAMPVRKRMTRKQKEEYEQRDAAEQALRALAGATRKVLTPESLASLIAARSAGLTAAREAQGADVVPTSPDGAPQDLIGSSPGDQRSSALRASGDVIRSEETAKEGD